MREALCFYRRGDSHQYYSPEFEEGRGGERELPDAYDGPQRSHLDRPPRPDWEGLSFHPSSSQEAYNAELTATVKESAILSLDSQDASRTTPRAPDRAAPSGSSNLPGLPAIRATLWRPGRSFGAGGLPTTSWQTSMPGKRQSQRLHVETATRLAAPAQPTS